METNTQQVKQHLEYLTRRWSELPKIAQFEIRCIFDNTPAWSKKFLPEQLDQAVQYAVWANKQGRNVYTTVNPIDYNANSGNASDPDIIGSFFCFADCDDPASMANVRQNIKDGFKQTFSVHTGKKPVRGHVYYELAAPMTDMAAWREMQVAIAKKFNSDGKIVNPSRIMRLAGTISYPDASKKKKGRVTELTELLEYKPILKTVEALKKNFMTYSTPEKFEIQLPNMTNNERLDLVNSINSIRQNVDWHDNMIKVVASMVSRGSTDDDIHQALVGITQPGFTIEQTTKEINVAIDGARAKGFDININNKIRSELPPVDADVFRQWQNVDPLHLPRKDFLYSYHYIRKFASCVIAPPGVGKSALVLLEAICMVTGRPLLDHHTKKCRVAYFNAEDPIDEIQERVLSILQHYKISQDEIKDLYIGSGRDTEIILMANDSGGLNDNAIESLEQIITEKKIDVLILDPFQNLHSASESNENFRTMCRALSMLADRCNISVMFVHHTRKTAPGQEKIDAEDARGGGALIGVVRSLRVINRMSQQFAEKYNLDNPNDYFNVEAGKSNLHRIEDESEWYMKKSQELPNKDNVVVVEKFTLPSAFDGISMQQLKNTINAIGKSDIVLMSNINAAKSHVKMPVQEFIADQLELDYELPHTKRRVKIMLREWLENDILREETVCLYDYDPKKYRRRDNVKRIVLGEARYDS